MPNHLTPTILALLALLFTTLAPPAGAADPVPIPVPITITFPGPRNISYLPIDLIPAIGADRAEGVRVNLRHVGGGSVALQEMMSRNADFAVAGLPAAMSLRLKNPGVVAVAAVDDLTLFILMVRSELREKVRSVADLRGMTIGVNTSSLTSKTTSQQLAELVLRNAGVQSHQVRLLAAGQSWEEQSSLIRSATVDAIMGDEPFASRLRSRGEVFFLVNLADPATAAAIPGAGFLHAAVETRADLLADEPDKVAAMVRMLRRTLAWIAGHTAAELVQALGLAGTEEGTHLQTALESYDRLYSRDGAFSTRQLAQTDRFFRTTVGGNPRLADFSLEAMVDDRWAGRKE